MTATKRCTGCGLELPETDFQIKSKRTGQRRAICPACKRRESVEYKAKNAEKVKADNARYRAENREALAERQRRWREEHPDAYLAIHSKWKANNTDLVNAGTHRRRNGIKKNGGSWTAAEWQAIKAEQDHRCLMCGRQEPEIKLTVDHIIPVSFGGPNIAANLQGLCKSCNSKKARKVLDLRKKADEAEEGGS